MPPKTTDDLSPVIKPIQIDEDKRKYNGLVRSLNSGNIDGVNKILLEKLNNNTYDRFLTGFLLNYPKFDVSTYDFLRNKAAIRGVKNENSVDIFLDKNDKYNIDNIQSILDIGKSQYRDNSGISNELVKNINENLSKAYLENAINKDKFDELNNKLKEFSSQTEDIDKKQVLKKIKPIDVIPKNYRKTNR